MQDPDSLSPDDRVLLLGAPEASVALRLAGRLSRGLLVILCGAEEVAAGRQIMRDADNVMFVPLEDNLIPWRDGFFTVVVDLRGQWPNAAAMEREIARVKTASN